VSSTTTKNNSNNATTIKDQKKKGNESRPNDDDLLSFNEDEMGIYNEISKELKQDNENFSDLAQFPEEKPDMSQEQLKKLEDDPDTKTLERDPYDPPTLNDAISGNAEVGKLTNQDLEKIKKDAIDDRNNTVAYLAAERDIAIHIYAGSRGGKSVWIEKRYYFNPISMRQDMHLNQLRSRQATLSVHNTLLLNQPIHTLTDQQKAFMRLAPIMIDVAGYRLTEEEARLRLGMSADDFSKVQKDEYNLVQRVLEWRTLYPPPYRRER
jgi:hypothetical protein